MEEGPGKSSKREPLYIESHPVYFPHDAYQSQKMVIIKVLQGLRNRRNCLIESPTGSGKTLALLCSCLAWQKKRKEVYEAQVAKMMQEMQASEWEFEEELGCYSYVPRHSTANSAQAVANASVPLGRQHSSPMAQRSSVPNRCCDSPCQPKVALANKLSSAAANKIAEVNSSTPGIVTPDATQVGASMDQSVASGSPFFPVSASQTSSAASLPPQLPAALAAHLPVHLGGLLQAPPKPGTKYVVVQNKTGQALNLDTLLALPQLRGSKETVIIQCTAPAQPQAAGEPPKPQPVRSLLPPSTANDEDDFQPSKKIRQSLSVPAQTNVVAASSPNQKSLLKSNAAAAVISAASQQQCQQPQPCCSALHATPSKGQQGIADKPVEKVPTIYYGTRTHKQIAQVVRELRKTDYRHARMAILSSRERTCIHPKVSRSSNKNERCKELIDDLGCRFLSKLRRDGAPRYPTANFEPYDLEDLVAIGERKKVCPYYWSLDLAPSADIIFCPYNYLIDPVVRKCLSIDLTDAVVVLDEAHNIEDISREVMSFTVTQDQLRDIIKDLEDMQRLRILPDEHCAIARVMSKLSIWITQHSDHLNDYRRFEESGKVWAGNEILAFMTDVGLSPDSFKAFKNTVAAITAVDKEQQQQQQQQQQEDPETYRYPAVSAATSSTLQNLVIILEFMYGSELKYLGDFRAAMVKSPSRNKQTELSKFVSGGGLSAAWTHSLSFWCLNPAVAMSDIKDKVHSLIVASGTLTPMESFESELDMPFKSQLQANHVIPPEGVWVGGIGCGPNNVNLTANFKTAETFEFQDEIGLILFDICRTVPNGVLCFFPSYSMMNKLSQRWQNTGMWRQLEGLKHIAVEPQKADTNTFDDTMSEFFRRACGEDEDCDGTDGALLFAVCRGKVSEGLDFADSKARAVVTVGIPFPNVKDMQVDLKRKYNDQQSRSGRPVMGGNAWYETQAFRALNQALGRCIRHRDDWGALIIIDHRFSQQMKFRKALSKWIREQFQCFQFYNEAMDSLKSFMDSKTSMSRKFPSTGHKKEFGGAAPSNDCSMLSETDTSIMYTDSMEPIELSDDSSQEMYFPKS